MHGIVVQGHYQAKPSPNPTEVLRCKPFAQVPETEIAAAQNYVAELSILSGSTIATSDISGSSTS
jgi:hypothetical protein